MAERATGGDQAEDERAARLLAVDDEPRNLALLRAYLEPLGYQLTTAGGGREALALLDAASYDLVLLDLMMPEVDGIDVLTHLRARDEGPFLPVILITALTDREARLRGFEAGADEFLVRPVDRELLITRIATLLRLKRATDALAERNLLLRRLQRRQRELTSGVVRDLRAPLAKVAANVKRVRERIPDEDADLHEAMADIEAATERVQTMVDDLLVIARLEAFDLPLHRSSVAVDGLLAEVVREYARRAADTGIRLELAPEQGVTVSADLTLLRRVLDNIVDNSLRHTPPSGVVRLSSFRDDVVSITVANTGRPVPVEERALIFEKFSRGSRPTGGRYGNVGLGLYFCKLAVEAHGGRIEATQTAEWPTCFVLRLPATAP